MIDNYLRLDRKRREIVHSGGEHAPLFQPHANYRTLDFDKPLSTRMVQKIVKRWADGCVAKIIFKRRSASSTFC